MVGDEPVEGMEAELIRCGDDGEEIVSCDDLVDVGTAVVVVGAASGAGAMLARVNLVVGDTRVVVPRVGWAGLCCRAESSANTSIAKVGRYPG